MNDTTDSMNQLRCRIRSTTVLLFIGRHLRKEHGVETVLHVTELGKAVAKETPENHRMILPRRNLSLGHSSSNLYFHHHVVSPFFFVCFLAEEGFCCGSWLFRYYHCT